MSQSWYKKLVAKIEKNVTKTFILETKKLRELLPNWHFSAIVS